jgi:hypothetical protein
MQAPDIVEGSSISSQIVTTAAGNSSQLFREVSTDKNSQGIWNRQALPMFREKPPMPEGQALDQRMLKGRQYMRRFRLIPVWAMGKNH